MGQRATFSRWKISSPVDGARAETQFRSAYRSLLAWWSTEAQRLADSRIAQRVGDEARTREVVVSRVVVGDRDGVCAGVDGCTTFSPGTWTNHASTCWACWAPGDQPAWGGARLWFVEAELPGLDASSLELFVTGGNQLTLKGERARPAPPARAPPPPAATS